MNKSFAELAYAECAQRAASIVALYRSDAPEGFDPLNSKTDAWESGMLQHLFQNANVANIGDATGIRGSTVAGSLYVSLHLADPGEAGNQATNEANYTGYARTGVVRTAGGWAESNGTVSNAGIISFAQCSAGSNFVTHWGIGSDPSGNGTLLYKGPATTPLGVTTGIFPQFAASSLLVIET